uniref:Putative secreted protein n=1 Tax=Anopheles marajoara TaxID=58244 RepID=A0A2M4CBX2_9DIPT
MLLLCSFLLALPLGPQHRSSNHCSLCSLGCSCTGSSSSSSSSNGSLCAPKFWGRSRQGGPWTNHNHTHTRARKGQKKKNN